MSSRAANSRQSRWVSRCSSVNSKSMLLLAQPSDALAAEAGKVEPLRSSSAVEDRRPLLEKGGHPFLSVAGVEEVGEGFTFELVGGGKCQVRPLGDDALGARHGERP